MSDVEPIRDPHEIRRILKADCTPQPGATMTTYLGPVRDELDRLRAALAAADQRIADLTTERDSERAFLKQRSDAVNRVGESNDTLRAQLAAVRKLVHNGPHVWSDEAGACIDVDDLMVVLGIEPTP